MKNPIYYAYKFLKHLISGTLFERIRLAQTRKRMAQLDKWWDRQAKTAEYFDSEVEENVKLRLYFDSAIAQDIYCHDHEIYERKFVKSFLKNGDTYIDIGANMGLYSIIASNAVGPEGHVFAFEPDSKTHNNLLFNLAQNGCENVNAFQLALSDKNESRDMQISAAGFDAYNSFGTPVRGEGTFEVTEVKCVSFDSFSQTHEQMQRATMIKVDVEGWETMVLKGAENILKRDDAPVLQIEFNDATAKAVGQPCSELYLWLEKLGYKIYTFNAKAWSLKPHPYQEHYVYDNVFAIKNLPDVIERISS